MLEPVDPYHPGPSSQQRHQGSDWRHTIRLFIGVWQSPPQTSPVQAPPLRDQEQHPRMDTGLPGGPDPTSSTGGCHADHVTHSPSPVWSPPGKCTRTVAFPSYLLMTFLIGSLTALWPGLNLVKYRRIKIFRVKIDWIVILWVYYTIPFGFCLILALFGHNFSIFETTMFGSGSLMRV